MMTDEVAGLAMRLPPPRFQRPSAMVDTLPFPMPPPGMFPGRACIQLITHYESCSLTAYPDPGTGGDPWTIGFGDTGPDVVEGLTISYHDAVLRLVHRLNDEFVPAVHDMARMPLTQQMFDALVDFAYNCGTYNLASSTLLRLLNDLDYGGASNEFGKWINSGGHPMKGLERRREADRLVFLGFDAPTSIERAEALFP